MVWLCWLLPGYGGAQPLADPEPLRPGTLEFRWQRDVPLLLGGGGLAILGEYLAQETHALSPDQLAAYNREQINAFDRPATYRWNPRIARASDLVAGVAAVSPLLLLTARDVRREFIPVLVVYAETATATLGITNIVKGSVQRVRPYVYNPEVPVAQKSVSDARHSFFSGHTSNTAAFSFLTAYLISRYSEQPTVKAVAWTGAALVPATVGLLRFEAGRHFPTDILVGYAVGAGIGVLIPHLHRFQLPPDLESRRLDFGLAGNGLYLVYHLP
ncbi:Membrane-associated phospholipid phosphatase [Catalinimonas alkaloidigena]|uniref:Membrane-associated phospholipid phosphatase n=2 Tax=Catalinimonas alkaloidigena TaxID=1075417 RepID=A0A1G9TL72_9BACT|nr:Membrane-associated phospholipid phosphatase [Catalinimonas alkaloidigena]